MALTIVYWKLEHVYWVNSEDLDTGSSISLWSALFVKT